MSADEWGSVPAYVPRSAPVTRPSVDAEYAAYLHSEYLAACEATNGYMVNAGGKTRGYTSTDFFKVGRRPSVERWGSEELRAWFGSGDAASSDTAGWGHVLSKTEYVAALDNGRDKRDWFTYGGGDFGPDTVSRGDVVLVRGGWRRVLRVKARSVHCETGKGWVAASLYGDIRALRSVADVAARRLPRGVVSTVRVGA